jgi:chemotaxis protein MotA
MITGVIALAQGMAPRAMEDHLVAYLSPKSRKNAQQEKAA